MIQILSGSICDFSIYKYCDFSIYKYHDFGHMYAKFPYNAFKEQLDEVCGRIKTTNFECFICGINHSF